MRSCRRRGRSPAGRPRRAGTRGRSCARHPRRRRARARRRRRRSAARRSDPRWAGPSGSGCSGGALRGSRPASHARPWGRATCARSELRARPRRQGCRTRASRPRGARGSCDSAMGVPSRRRGPHPIESVPRRRPSAVACRRALSGPRDTRLRAACGAEPRQPSPWPGPWPWGRPYPGLVPGFGVGPSTPVLDRPSRSHRMSRSAQAVTISTRHPRTPVLIVTGCADRHTPIVTDHGARRGSRPAPKASRARPGRSRTGGCGIRGARRPRRARDPGAASRFRRGSPCRPLR